MCQKCGFIFLNPRFTQEDLILKYKVLKNLGTEENTTNKYSLKYYQDKRAKRVYNLIKYNSSFEEKNDLKILDYGGATGYNLKYFLEKFKTFIIDYYERDFIDPKIEYLGKDLEELKNNNNQKFDIILLLHTLEHISKPKKFLNNLITLLKEDGIIYIEVPLGCYMEWNFLTEPLTHINFFSEQSLYSLCKLCGLNIKYINTSYQWVVTKNKWNLNIICTKSDKLKSVKSEDVLLTHFQLLKLKYFIIDLFSFNFSLKSYIKSLYNKFLKIISYILTLERKVYKKVF